MPQTFVHGFNPRIGRKCRNDFADFQHCEQRLEGALYILVFGAGTIISMLLFNTVIGIPFVMGKNKMKINKSLVQFAGLISIVFGIYYMYNLDVTEGLFKLWV